MVAVLWSVSKASVVNRRLARDGMSIIRTFQWRKTMLKRILVTAAVVAPIVIVSASAQQPAITRTPLQTVDFPPGYQTVSVIAEIAPSPCIGRHTHPGIESTYAMEGEVVVKIDGKPDQVVKAGNSIVFASG